MKPFSLSQLLMVVLEGVFSSIDPQTVFDERINKHVIRVRTNPMGGGISFTLSDGTCEVLGIKSPTDSFDINKIDNDILNNVFGSLYVVGEERIDEDGDNAFQVFVFTSEEYKQRNIVPVQTEAIPV